MLTTKELDALPIVESLLMADQKTSVGYIVERTGMKYSQVVKIVNYLFDSKKALQRGKREEKESTSFYPFSVPEIVDAESVVFVEVTPEVRQINGKTVLVYQSLINRT